MAAGTPGDGTGAGPALVDGAATLVAPQAAARGLAFSVSGPDRPLVLQTDLVKARRIL